MNIVNSINYNINFYGKTKKNKLIQPTNENLQAGFGKEKLQLMDIMRKAAKEKKQDIYLFGGAVRDCMLNKPINDLDFIINGDAIEFAKDLKQNYADIFKGIFLKPSVKRAVVYTKKMGIDFKSLTDSGETVKGKDNLRKALIKSLQDNDFSVNSMVIKLDENKAGNMKLKFLDYLKGKPDLIQNQLRHNNNSSFMADPIKALRGLRLKLTYGMKIKSETCSLLKESLKNPKTKKNKFYLRYARECLRIIEVLFKKLF